MAETAAPWMDMVKPIADRFGLAADMGLEIAYRGDGARAVAKLLTAMAEKLDLALMMQRADPPGPLPSGSE